MIFNLREVCRITVVIIIFFCNKSATLSTPLVTVDVSELKIQVFFHPNASSYKSLSLQKDTLYIGGTGSLFRQDANNITQERHLAINWMASENQRRRCEVLPQSEEGLYCRNFVRVINLFNSSYMFVCGSMAMEGKFALLDIQMGNVIEIREQKIPLCSIRPNEPGIAIVDNDGKASSIIAVSRLEGNEGLLPVKSFPDFSYLKTTLGKNQMIDKKSYFVSSFRAVDNTSHHIMEKMYFLYNEAIREPADYNRNYGSRIAQVCDNDRGGKLIRKDEWTSFLKVSILCQSNEKNPFIFEEITHSSLGDDGILFATFTTLNTQYRKSAVCAFRLVDIQQAFHSKKFWDGLSSKNYKKIVTGIPHDPSPGDCAYPGMVSNSQSATSKDFSLKFLTFMSRNFLMVTPVYPIHPLRSGSGQSGPVLDMNGEYFTQIVVETVEDLEGEQHTIMFIATQSGKLYKTFSILMSNGAIENRILAMYDFGKEAIDGLLLSNSKPIMYVQTSSNVTQMSTGNCAVYSKRCEFCDQCRMCVLARDPTCAWDSQTKSCIDIRSSEVQSRKSQLKQDVKYEKVVDDMNICGNITPEYMFYKDPPIGVFVISLGKVVTNAEIKVRWYNQTEQTPELLLHDSGSSKYRINSDKKLEIMKFSKYDVSTYTAEYILDGFTVAYDISSYTGESLPLPVPPSSPIYKTETLSKGETTTEVNNRLVSIANPNSAAFPFSSIMCIILSLIIVGLLVLLWKPLFRKIIFSSKKKGDSSISGDDKSAPNPVGTVAYRNESNNSNKEIANKETDFSLKIETVDEDEIPLIEIKQLTRKKELTTQQFTGKDVKNCDKSDVGDSVHARNFVLQAKSFRSKNVVVKLPNDNSRYRCNSVQYEKDRDMWVMEVQLPKGYTFDKNLNDGQINNDESSVDPPLVEVATSDQDSQFTSKNEIVVVEFNLSSEELNPIAQGDAIQPVNDVDQVCSDLDSDSDSTVVASEINQNLMISSA